MKEQREKAKRILTKLYDRVCNSWPGFVPRQGQVVMMDAALDAFLNCREPGASTEGEHIAVVEAPTGTGKTMGYLLAAIAAAKVLDKKVVVSTATVALQEQLVLKDLPRLKECIGDDLSFDILKGRQRYVCLHKLTREGELDPELLDLFDGDKALTKRPTPSQQPVDQRAASLRSELAAAATSGRWDGDRDTWEGANLDAVWSGVAADSMSCTRSKCAHFKKCAFYAARKRASEARIQVANHSLVLATMANDGTTLEPSKTLFVFDEGHHIGEAGIDQFTSSMRLQRTIRALDRTRSLLPKARAAAPSGAAWIPLVQDAIEAARECSQAMGRLHADILDHPHLSEVNVLRFESGVLPEPWSQAIGHVASGLSTVMKVATPAMQDLLEDENEAGAARVIASEWSPWASTLVEAQGLLKQFLSHDRVPLAKWVTVDQDSGTVTLSASPLTAAKALGEQVWSRVGAALVTSATMTACGSFDFFARVSGLSRFPMRTDTIAPSAFDHRRQARLCIPRMSATPKDGAAFTAELAKKLPDLLQPFGAGQLCLFASRRQMEAVMAALPATLREFVLCQDGMSRARLLANHRERIASGNRSIIFGLQSLGEGVDLPGKLCEHVLIEKIPFAPPDSPVDAALAEWLEGQQRDAFNEVTLPRAGVKLAQWAGRAVRTVDDRAVITICDSRLRAARYGRRLLLGLPKMPLIDHPGDARF